MESIIGIAGELLTAFHTHPWPGEFPALFKLGLPQCGYMQI